MIGYHYTSLENFKKIQEEGLRPYLIKKPCLFEVIGSEETMGVWVWQDKLEGLSHVGSILYQNATKNTVQVVYLEVYYDSDNILAPAGEPEMFIQISHTGNIENLDYHNGSEKAYVVTTTIPPEHIQLLETYNLLDAWKEEPCLKKKQK